MKGSDYLVVTSRRNASGFATCVPPTAISISSSAAASAPFRRPRSDADKPEILRAYLKRWKAEVGVFFDGTSASSTDEQLPAIAPKHPVFDLDEV